MSIFVINSHQPMTNDEFRFNLENFNKFSNVQNNTVTNLFYKQFDQIITQISTKKHDETLGMRRAECDFMIAKLHSRECPWSRFQSERDHIQKLDFYVLRFVFNLDTSYTYKGIKGILVIGIPSDIISIDLW